MGARVNAGWCFLFLLGWAGMSWALEGAVEKEKETGWKADLARMGFEVPVEELEKGEMVGQKWLAGGARPGFLGAKVFFLAGAPPEKVARAILKFDRTKGEVLPWEAESSVKIYERVSRPPTAESWGRFREALGKFPFDTLLSVEGQREGKLHLHPEEIAAITQNKVEGWISILEKRMQTFQRGGWEENGGVPSGPDQLVDFDEELRDVLEENGPVRDEFRGVLSALAYGGRNKKEKAEVNDYWQLMEADKSPGIALGCGVMRQGTGGRWEVADMNYYASTAYYGSISLYGVWPYGEGKSLVCRMDVVEADPGRLSQATARLIGESIFMREVRSGCKTILEQIIKQ